MTADLRRALAELADLAPSRLDRPSPAAAGRRRQTARRALAAAGAALLLVAGVAGAAVIDRPGDSDALLPARQPDPQRAVADGSRASFLPGPGPGQPSRAARSGGTLDGDPASGCLWLATPSGARVPVLIRHDTAVADFSAAPWVIRDGERVLAREGDQVALGGGYPAADFAGAVPGCPVDGIPFIGTLPVVEPDGVAPSGGTAGAPSPAAGASRTRTIKIFLRSESEGDCTVVVPVDRQVPDTEAIATAALQELFSGRLTDEERAAGLRGYGPETAGLLRRLRIADGIAYVDLNASYRDVIGYASTSCGAGGFGATIGSTLRQFPTVTQIRYAFDGDPRDFVEWSQGGCPDDPIPPGDPCDPRPWREPPG